MAARGTRILYGASGKGLTKESMGNYMMEAIKAAGLPKRCRMHGLRKVAAVMLAEAGCSSREIMAITGHKSLSEAERYTDEVDRKKLAQSARNRQLGPREN